MEPLQCGPAMLSRWKSSPGVSLYIFWLNNRYFQTKFFKKKMKKNLENFGWICQWLSQSYWKPPWGVSRGSPDDFRRDIIAGPHGTSWTNWWIDSTYIECMYEFDFYCFYSTVDFRIKSKCDLSKKFSISARFRSSQNENQYLCNKTWHKIHVHNLPIPKTCSLF